MFYVEVVQAVLLYGLETWVMSPRIVRTLGGFRRSVARRLIEWQPRRVIDGMWVYPLLAEAMDEAMAEALLKEVETYIPCCNNTVVQYIATRPIMYLCMWAESCPGTRLSKRWWDQEAWNF